MRHLVLILLFVLTGICSFAQDTLYIYESGSVVYKKATHEIDSITFLNSGNLIVKDYEGNAYKTVKIGTQLWMAENLKSTKYNDGTEIPFVPDSAQWRDLTSPGYCWYNNDYQTYANVYGGLYNFYTVETGKLCPTGWHVPSDTEWIILVNYLGGESVAGAKLKEAGFEHWSALNTNATNESGFTGLPGGLRFHISIFHGVNDFGYFATSTEYDSEHLWKRNLEVNQNSVSKDYIVKKVGLSVRCVKD